MKRLDQVGMVDSWLVAFVVTLTLFVAAAGFGGWAFMSRNDYKTNVDAKISEAVAAAEKATSAKKDVEFVEKEKEPFRNYTGPVTFASVSITYPKTWSAYVDEAGKGASIIDGYFNPAVVPGLTSGSNIAVRLQVLNASFATQVATYNQQVKNNSVRVTPYRPAKVPSVTGVRIDGEIFKGKQGSMIIVPVRDKTVKVWTEASQFVGDLDKIILPSLTFIP